MLRIVTGHNLTPGGHSMRARLVFKFAAAIRLPVTILPILAAGAIVLPDASAQGLYIYPTKGQSQDQQNRDRYECHSWAVSQTGFDPTQAQVQSYAPPPPQGQVLRGAGGGAAIGAVGGAIGGNAGKGAAIGAATGALIGGIRRHRDHQQYQAQQSQQASASAAQQNAYNRAISACLQGRGYNVN